MIAVVQRVSSAEVSINSSIKSKIGQGLLVLIGIEEADDQIDQEYDAIFLGVGTYKNMRAGLENEEAPGVFDALPYLISNTNQLLGYASGSDNKFNMAGKKVVVLA